MGTVIGRKHEQRLLENILQSGEPELVVVYGRRRVGKTFLVKNVYEKQLAFDFSCIHNAALSQQFENFTAALSRASGNKLAMPKSWIGAFDMLIAHLEPLIKRQRRAIFIDEFPWGNTPKSGFLQAFENFWNTWASNKKNLVVVICGSAAAWMIQRVINNKGGLYNRVTQKIGLLPFTVAETEEYLQSKKVNLDRLQILQLYMVMGGIPHYLRNVAVGESAAQVINKTCFAKDGVLADEFKSLFQSLFNKANEHIAIVKALSKKGSGLSRNEIIKECNLSSGGGTTQLLDELTESGFITPYIPFGKTAKDAIYWLTDEYSHFYLKFIEHGKIKGDDAWERFSTGASWRAWSGTAFEAICMKHVHVIKKALGIGGVYTETSTWRHKANNGEQGSQIDLLIDRRDGVINICEMKFSIEEFAITKSYADELRSKLSIFKSVTRTRKTLFLTMLTTHGVTTNIYKTGLVQQDLTMDVLFDN